MERVMKSFTLIFAAATTLTMVTASNGQAYLNGAPIGGVGTYAPGPGPSGSADDPRFRDNNWRNSTPDNWRDNNWREDRSQAGGVITGARIAPMIGGPIICVAAKKKKIPRKRKKKRPQTISMAMIAE